MIIEDWVPRQSSDTVLKIQLIGGIALASSGSAVNKLRIVQRVVST